jgi:lipopolysaccharide/colanic/teichoic acid biosynthesis glycosyltransferase
LEELFGTRKKLFDAYKQEIHDRKLDVRIADVDITDECLLAKFQNLNKYKKNDTVIYPDKVRLNCYYYRHYSFIKDIEIIFATLLGFKVKFAGEEV